MRASRVEPRLVGFLCFDSRLNSQRLVLNTIVVVEARRRPRLSVSVRAANYASSACIAKELITVLLATEAVIIVRMKAAIINE
jgi:hypothetical protein